jgi:hypothetical protein
LETVVAVELDCTLYCSVECLLRFLGGRIAVLSLRALLWSRVSKGFCGLARLGARPPIVERMWYFLGLKRARPLKD